MWLVSSAQTSRSKWNSLSNWSNRYWGVAHWSVRDDLMPVVNPLIWDPSL